MNSSVAENGTPSNSRDGCATTHASGKNGSHSSPAAKGGKLCRKLNSIRAPTTRVEKHVASSSKACSQYRSRRGPPIGRGKGREYSSVEVGIGELSSDMILGSRPEVRTHL